MDDNKITPKNEDCAENISVNDDITASPDGEEQQGKGESKIKATWRKIRSSEYFYLLGAFFLPVIIMAGAYAATEFFPFGNLSILSLDFQSQYIYYFEYLRELLTEGGDWFYTWSRTLGGEFMGYISYYLGSPFNFMVVLFPRNHIAVAAAFIVLAKVGAMGVTFSLYLHKTRRSSPLQTILFSAMYALSGYVAIQQFNPMWLDAVIWLPLLVLGIESLIKERKVILYIVSIFLILTSNYYIGYMCCIFTVLYFAYYYFLVRPELVPCGEAGEKKGFFSYCGTRAFMRIGFATVVAVMMSAFMLLCAYYSLTFGKSGFSNPSFAFDLKFDFLDLFVKMLVGSYDTVRENGLPLIYSGLLTLIFIPLFYTSPEISGRRKILSSALVGVMIVSFMLNPVDLAWHGFSMPNWLNYRYSFLFSFIVIIMAYDAFSSMKSIRFKDVAKSAVAVLLLIFIVQKLNYTFSQKGKSVELDDILTIAVSVLFVLIYMLILYGMYSEKYKSSMLIALAVIVSVELMANSIIHIVGIRMDVGVVKYNNYPSSSTGNVERYDSYRGSVERMRIVSEKIKELDESFYRMENTLYRQRGGPNEQMAGGFYGISSSTSTLNKSVIRLMSKFGYSSTSHWTKYLGGTPVGDAIFGIKYVISSDRPTEGNGGTIYRNNYHSFDSNFYVKVYETEEPYHVFPSDYSIYVMQNTKALPIAYGVSRNVLDFGDVFSVTEYEAAMELQSRLINTMLSEKGNYDVLKPLAMTYGYEDCTVNTSPLTYNWDGVSHTSDYLVLDNFGDKPSITFSVTALEDGVIYMHFPTVNFGKTGKIYVNGKHVSDFGTDETNCAMEVGTYKTGDVVKVKIVPDVDKMYIAASSETYFWYVDYEEMTEAFDLLLNSSMTVTEYDNAYLAGNIFIEDGQELVFTTIPYDRGWNVYVDGNKVETVMVLDSLMAFETTGGYHEIEMRYFPSIYKVGIAVSALGILIFVAVVLYNKNEKANAFVKEKLLPKEKAEESDACE